MEDMSKERVNTIVPELHIASKHDLMYNSAHGALKFATSTVNVTVHATSKPGIPLPARDNG